MPKRLASDPKQHERLLAFVRDWIDRRRFPWVREDWEPQEYDRKAATMATSALLAMRRLEERRRNTSKEKQERLVAQQLERTGFTKVASRTIRTLSDAPKLGEFCPESKVGTRKADLVVGLWDGRSLLLECKVSNSATNSVKRLNNDAAVKAERWREDFGSVQIVSAAVLSGVYKTHNLEEAQRRGLTLFWAHDLESMKSWLHKTKSGSSTG